MEPDGWDQPARRRSGGAATGRDAPGRAVTGGGDATSWGLDAPTEKHSAWSSGAWSGDDGVDDHTAPLDIVAAPAASAPRRTGYGDSGQGENARSGRARRGVLLVTVLVLLGCVVGGGLYLYSSLFSTPDFEGEGAGDVVVQVRKGDSTTQIGNELAARGVVAGLEAFIEAATEDERIRSVQPGYYRLRSAMSAESAVALLLDPAARVGQLEIKGGTQLDDTSAPDGTVAPGVLSLISQASCATLDGQQRCVSVDELRTAMSQADPAALGVPEWALEAVAVAEPKRRLEGLIVPGRYDVRPGTSAEEVLRALLATSAASLEEAELVSGAASMGSTPYQVLIIASLVEKEAITPDMPKVARVIYNRLDAGRRLELDSMVNYPLDLQALRTTPEDRARPGPYNSYAVAGPPPTPISAPGPEAIAAALAPEPGPWSFFVRCETDGTSCFAETFAEHLANVRKARENGAF